MSRAYNFSAGPATLPLEVLEEAQREFVDFRATGMSLLESSHRGKAYAAVHEEAIANLRDLLRLPDDYAVLFLQGGASLQFAMVPMNLLPAGRTADYVNSGSWASKAIKEARKLGAVQVAADTSKEIPTRLPSAAELALTPNAAYVHITSNETIAGTQWKRFPQADAPLVADMSSDILSRPFPLAPFGLIYAGAQKNLGPAGVCLVVVRKDLAARASQDLPTMLQYRTHIAENSLYNTPPCFGVYIVMLVTRWVRKIGLENLYRQNAEKAARIYDVIDGSDFFRGVATPEDRSDMNVTFRLPTEELEAAFVKEAEARNLKGLKGHRSVGGLRASIYNAFPLEGIEALVTFMREFARTRG